MIMVERHSYKYCMGVFYYIGTYSVLEKRMCAELEELHIHLKKDEKKKGEAHMTFGKLIKLRLSFFVSARQRARRTCLHIYLISGQL